MPATESPVAFQVQGDALKQMLPIEETETAALEYLDLIVQTLDKATTQPLTEVVGNPVEPGIQQGQEGRVAGEPAGYDLLPPAFDRPDARGFGLDSIKDRRERLAQIIGLFQHW